MNVYFLLSILSGASALILNHPGNCMNRCFTRNDYSHGCQCSPDCETIGNCCPDFWTRCRGPLTGLVVTAQELTTFAQSIWDNDVNRIASTAFTLNYQGQTTSNSISDLASGPLISQSGTSLDTKLADSSTTYPSFINLLDNYVANVRHMEHRPNSEINEENQFWKAATQTKVMNITYSFLVSNGFIKGDLSALRTVFNELWFELYPKGHISSLSESGFERIMTGEVSNHHATQTHNATSIVLGFHNWVQFYLQEKAGNINYKGYIAHVQNPNIANISFTWNNATAKNDSFFVGTSPEFDMAMYTVCALAHPNSHCDFQINGQQISIQTHTATHRQIMQILDIYPKLPGTATGSLPAMPFT